MAIERRLAAILAADVEGYSRLMAADEEGTLRALTARRAAMDRLIAAHRGRIVGTAGDGVLAEFASVVDAVTCALAVQATIEKQNESEPSGRQMRFRIGINLGDVLVQGADIFGDGVNVAARLETLAEPGGICVSGIVRDQVLGKVEAGFVDLGEQQVKNIAHPVRAWRVGPKVAPSAAPGEPRPALPLPDKPSLVVLPFENMSGDAEQEYFADGMTEEITTALSRIRQFFVIARNTAFTYKGKHLDLRQVGRELGVRYLLEGSVRKAGGRVRITGQLIEAESGAHLWADKFDGALDDVFELQDRITESVVGAVEPSITKAEIERARRKPPNDLKAHDFVLRAMGEARPFSTASARVALELVRQAIALDPRHALAHSRVAYYIALLRSRDALRDDISETEEGVRCLLRAIELGPDDPSVLAWSAMARPWLDRRTDLAIAWLDRAIELDPNSIVAFGFGAHVRNWAGDYATAEEHAGRAIRLSPFDYLIGNFQYFLGMSHLLRRRPEQALPWLRKSTQSDPGSNGACFGLVCALAHCGLIAEARVELARNLKMQPTLSLSWQRRTRVYQIEADWEYALAGARMAGLPD